MAALEAQPSARVEVEARHMGQALARAPAALIV